jgi:hypothetical protein
MTTPTFYRILDWLPVEIEQLVRRGTLLCDKCNTIQAVGKCHVDGCTADACTSPICTCVCVTCRGLRLYTCLAHRDDTAAAAAAAAKCEECNKKSVCIECAFSTDACDIVECGCGCGVTLCNLCSEHCEACENDTCAECRRECDGCGFQFLCTDCVNPCTCCQNVYCSSCGTSCDVCFEGVCIACVDDNVCRFCTNL